MSDESKNAPDKKAKANNKAVAKDTETSEPSKPDQNDNAMAGSRNGTVTEKVDTEAVNDATASGKQESKPDSSDEQANPSHVQERPVPYKKPGLVIGVTAKKRKVTSDTSDKPAGIVSDMKALWKRHSIVCAIIFILVLGGCAALVYNVNTSSYVTHDANPYRGYDTLAIVVGNQFSSLGTYEDGDGRQQNTDGIVVKVEPDGTVHLPLVKAKPGYTFMGWSQGGVKVGDEIDVDPSTTEIKLNADRHGYTRLYALFADSVDNGYCSCGDYQAAAYKDALKK